MLTFPTFLMLLALLVGAPPPGADDHPVSAGCASMTAERRQVGSRIVLDVVADHCPRVPNIHDRLSEAAWHSLRLNIDRIQVRADGPRSPTVVYTRTELRLRYGHGPTGPVSMPQKDSGSWLFSGLFLFLPLAMIGGLLLSIAGAYYALRSGAVIVFRR